MEGGERFRTITRSYYRGSRAMLFLYDVSDLESFKEIEIHYSDFIEKKDSNINCKLYLLANTIYPEKEVLISTEQAMKYATERDMEYCEISTKNDQGIQILLKNLATSLLV